MSDLSQLAKYQSWLLKGRTRVFAQSVFPTWNLAAKFKSQAESKPTQRGWPKRGGPLCGSPLHGNPCGDWLSAGVWIFASGFRLTENPFANKTSSVTLQCSSNMSKCSNTLAGRSDLPNKCSRTWYQLLGTWYLVTDTWHQVLGTLRLDQVAGTWYQAQDTRYPNKCSELMDSEQRTRTPKNLNSTH